MRQEGPGPSVIHQKSNKRNKLNQESYCQKVVNSMGQEGPSIIHQKSNKRNKLNQECYCQKVVYFSQEESGNHQRNETR